MLPVPPISATSEPKFQVSDELLQLVEQVKDKIKDEDLEFEPSSNYSLMQIFTLSTHRRLLSRMARRTHRTIAPTAARTPRNRCNANFALSCTAKTVVGAKEYFRTSLTPKTVVCNAKIVTSNL